MNHPTQHTQRNPFDGAYGTLEYLARVLATGNRSDRRLAPARAAARGVATHAQARARCRSRSESTPSWWS